MYNLFSFINVNNYIFLILIEINKWVILLLRQDNTFPEYYNFFSFNHFISLICSITAILNVTFAKIHKLLIYYRCKSRRILLTPLAIKLLQNLPFRIDERFRLQLSMLAWCQTYLPERTMYVYIYIYSNLRSMESIHATAAS